MIEQFITSFIASAGFGILFNAPKKSLIRCGFTGMIGWGIYFWLENEAGFDSVIATLIAAFVVALISQVFAKFYKSPIIIYVVSGIIPLVPGGLAYDAMRNFVINDYNVALQHAAKVFMLSGAIAMGLAFSEVINQLLKRIPDKKQQMKGTNDGNRRA